MRLEVADAFPGVRFDRHDARFSPLAPDRARRCVHETGRAACPRRRTGSASSPRPSTRPGDWATYNGPLSGDRYSPLTQITAANVGQIRQVCAFDAPEAVNFQSGIVAVNGVLYFTLFNHTYAVDGATCQQKWKHTRPEPDTFLMVNRGVAYSDGRLFRGTGDAHVLAINAADGKQLWDVSIGDPKKGESTPMAPIAWNGLVFAGNAGGDNFGVTGRIYALDAASGQRGVAVQHGSRLGAGARDVAQGVTRESARRWGDLDQLCPRRAERHSVRADRQSLAGLRVGAASGGQPLHERAARARREDGPAPLIRAADQGRFPRLGSGRRPRALHHPQRPRVRRRRSEGWPRLQHRPERRDESRERRAGCDPARDPQQGGGDDARERGGAVLDRARHPVLPRRPRRRRMERPDLPSGSRPALRQRHRLVHVRQDAARRQDERRARCGVDWRGARGRLVVRQARSGRSVEGVGDRVRRRERRDQVEDPDAQADGRGDHGDGGRPRVHRRSRWPPARLRCAHRQGAVAARHRESHRRRRDLIRRRWQAVHRRRHRPQCRRPG